MSDHLYPKVPDDHPNRCQGVNKFGQCRNITMEGSNYCTVHGAGENKAREAREMRNYTKGKWLEKIYGFADNPKLKSLNEEIGILRLQLENILNRCETDIDLLMHTDKLNQLIDKIERLVTSQHKLERSLGTLLDQNSIKQVATALIEVISEHISDEELLDTIAQGILSAIMTTNIKPNLLTS